MKDGPWLGRPGETEAGQRAPGRDLRVSQNHVLQFLLATASHVTMCFRNWYSHSRPSVIGCLTD